MSKKSSVIGSLLVSFSFLFVIYSCGLLKKKPQLSAITLAPPTSTIDVGKVKKFKATGTYTDASTADITDKVNWYPDEDDIDLLDDNAQIAVVRNPGEVQGLHAGQAEIKVELEKLTATSSVTVVSPTPTDSPTPTEPPTPAPVVLKSIVVSPSSPSISPSDTLQMHATGVKSDFSTEDPLTGVTWSSSDESAATVNSSSGLVTGVATGTTEITATKQNEASETITGKTTITVN